MIRLLTIVCFGLFTIATQAQIVEMPLNSNPILEFAARQKAEAQAAKLEAFRKQFPDITPSVLKNSAETLDPVYVISGESIEICNTDYNALTSSTVDISCSPLMFGTVSIQDTCFTYVADAGIDLGRDTVCLEFCTDGGTVCDTFNYPIVIKRLNFTSVKPVITLGVNEEATFSFENNVNALPGDFVSQAIVDETECGEYTDNDTFLALSGFAGIYQSTAFADDDEVCIVICDDATVCDTIKYIFEVEPIITSLPFFDDFTNDGPYPDTNNWLDNQVFINDTYGFRPPSVGVATFDGIDGSGTPYYMGEDRPSDILTSAYIDLSTSPQVFLSFYIQPKGLGDKPEVQDSLILQFRNNEDKWVQIDAFAGLTNIAFDSIPPFRREFYTNFDFQFKHAEFQFRFINKSNGRGMGDNWHLDYVLLTDQAQSSVFEDVAFTQRPNDILDPYSSMPWDHFEGNAATELDQFIEASLYNHSDDIANAAGSVVALTETTTNTTVYEASLYNGTEANITNGIVQNDRYDLDSDDPVIFPNVWTGLDYLNTMQNDFNGSDELSFDLTYELQSTLNTEPSNDVVTRTTIFSDYFAYDDGSAEGNIAAQGSGSQVAVQFHANKPDTIKAIQLFIPRVNANVSGQQFNLKVWIGSLEDDPVYTLGAQMPIYADLFADTIQGFTTYRLQNPATGEDEFVPIPVGDFYIGWEQVTNEFTNAIPVGLDKNNTEATEFLFGFINGSWSNVTTLQGATMIRPIVGDANPFTTTTETLADQTKENFHIYPNPSNGQFQIRLLSGDFTDYRIDVFNNMGQVVYQNILSQNIDLSGVESGLYFARILDQKNKTIHQERVMIVK